MDREEARERLLAAAEELFYTRGIRAVGMDEVRDRAGVPLARIYALYPSKRHLVAAYLADRDRRWRARLSAFVDRAAPEPDATARQRLLAVFDRLAQWFAEPGYRGCAFVNAWAEFGPDDALVAAAVREHKELFRAQLAGLARGYPDPSAVADRMLLLAEGAIVTSAILGAAAAGQARETAEAVLRAAELTGPGGARPPATAAPG